MKNLWQIIIILHHFIYAKAYILPETKPCQILHFAQLKILLKLKILFWAKSDAQFQSHFATL